MSQWVVGTKRQWLEATICDGSLLNCADTLNIPVHLPVVASILPDVLHRTALLLALLDP